MKNKNIQSFDQHFESSDNESKNTDIRVKDIISFLQTLSPEARVILDKDGWQNYGKEDMSKNDIIRYLFDDYKKDRIIVNN